MTANQQALPRPDAKIVPRFIGSIGMLSDSNRVPFRRETTATGPSPRGQAPEATAGDRPGAGRPDVALLKGYLQACALCEDALTPDLLQSFNRHVFDLVASILGATRGGGAAAEAEAGGVKAARLRTVLSAIAARASEPTFGIETLAAELAVTARYIQRILGETGRTFSEHLLDQRLRRAWQLLTDPRSRNLKVASVAFDCGFSDISTFNRTFRRRFGETPTAIRGAALDGALP